MASPNFKIAAQLYNPIPLPISTQNEDGSSSFSIRLLSVTSAPGEPIACRLWADPFDKATTRTGYYALSYVWGNASITEEITVNGLPFQATQNLVLALKWFLNPNSPPVRYGLMLSASISASSPSATTRFALWGRFTPRATRLFVFLAPRLKNTTPRCFASSTRFARIWNIPTCRAKTPG
ncbi:uncharacterized protein PODANS_1_5520 [Podospora anserina S mat+]|uniref:Podospora anserina S mat+ genomic DNA chromosome 1, supercontig 1 n=1 Tax=Podospora anserina (strain S / ATCC MYA-4624 / DSM 980 / FGSC 10383) TaxID=515849 RepID=B2AAX8_PODAN|nr:uncharacterized protein PODANS_1_5520 [Podospora anserina S mat+]CAP60240.1 unnamed protein product [Podospora anserina S mat+]CDP22880.1 Putative protein of unknown function [Podospora anserina S mat+]